LNFTRAEWQQAARTGQNPKAIKASLQECWATSDNKSSFCQALQQRGYVVVDIYGEVYSLSRQLGLKTKEIGQRLGNKELLPSVSEIKDKVSKQLTNLFQNFLIEQKKEQQKYMHPLLENKQDMTKQHRVDRASQKSYQQKRWQHEEQVRASKIRKGIKGFWDKLTGHYWKQHKQNETETQQALTHDRHECEDLIQNQLIQRQILQNQINKLENNQEKQQQTLISDLSKIVSSNENTQFTEQIQSKVPDKGLEKGLGNGFDFEPDIN